MCRLCIKEEKTPIHIVCRCPALINTPNMGRYIFHPEEVKNTPAKDVVPFLLDVGEHNRPKTINVLLGVEKPCTAALSRR